MKFIVTWEGLRSVDVDAETRYEAVMKAAEELDLKGRVPASGLCGTASVKRPGNESLGRWSKKKKEDAVKGFLDRMEEARIKELKSRGKQSK